MRATKYRLLTQSNDYLMANYRDRDVQVLLQAFYSSRVKSDANWSITTRPYGRAKTP